MCVETVTRQNLSKILVHATKEIDYYQTLCSAYKVDTDVPKLSDFPLLTRSITQRERHLFLDRRYQRYPDIEHLLIKRSFGYSGIPLEVYWDNRDYVHALDSLWAYRNKRFGIKHDDKCCIFHTAMYAGNKIIDYLPQNLSWDEKTLSFTTLNLSQERLLACIDAIYSFDPVWICAQPSVALSLAEVITNKKCPQPPSLRYVELHGEVLDAQTETIIRETFHAQTANVYATKATGTVAISCECGHLHILNENTVVEVVQEGKPVMDAEGDVYITSCQNNAMPLVRLKTGDRSIIKNALCICGQSAPVIQLTQSRNCNFITTTSGRKVSAFVLRSIAEYTNEEISRCLAYIRFRQTDYNCIDVILCLKPAFIGWEEEVVRVFHKHILDTELKQMRWNFIFSDLHELEEAETDCHPFFKPC